MYSEYDAFGALIAFLFMMAGVIIIFGLIVYVLTAFGLYKMAKVRSDVADKAFLAWIPVGNLYMIGLMLGDFNIFGKTIKNMEVVLPVLSLGSGVLFAIPVIGQVLSIAYLVFNFMVFMELFGQYEPDRKVIYTIFSPIGFLLVGLKASRGEYGSR